MLVSLNWLKDFVELPKNVDGKSLAHDLTLKTAEVDNVIDEGKIYEKMVVGHVLELHKHPNADKLKIAKVSIGKETVQIVCGGENLKEGMYVAVSLPGAKVKWHGEGEYVTLEETKIRGEKSYGMICAGNEIGIEDMRAHGEATGRARRERVPRDRSLQINRAQRDEQSGSASCETKRAYQTTSARDIMDLSSIKQAPGTPLQSLFGKNDIIFEFDNKSLTHRPDLWGHYGIAREIAAITKSKFKPISPKVKIPSTGEKIGLKIEAEDLCPRYCGLIINNIKVEESPDWLKTRLKATGHGTHNNIVDVTNYILAELGQPMHAFDKSYIKKGIVVRRAKKGEKITSLDNKERILSEEMLVIADHEKPVAIAGVMGGENSEINKNTTSIILESANFSASSVRRASTKLGLRTESVQRFEKALDPNLAELAIKRAAELILKICPKAVIAGPITDKGKFNKKPLKINLNYKTIISKIGVEISKKEIMEILKSLEFKVLQKAQGFTVEIPSFRATKDVLFEDDLIEEIARMFGYEKIPPSLPTLPTKLPMENTERFKKHRAREFMSYGLGFDEIYNYSFYGKKDFEKCLMTEKSHLKLLNSLSEEQTHLATSLIPNLLKNLESNTKYFDEIRLYEIGRTYKDTGTFYPLEEKYLIGLILIKEKSDKVFYEAKGVLESFFSHFNIKNLKEAKGVDKAMYANPSKAISFIDTSAQTLAKAYALRPTVLKNYSLENFSIAGFEINFTEILKLASRTSPYKKLARFPSIKIDVSVLIDSKVEVKTIEEVIKNSDKNLIKETNLFDIYEGKNIEDDKKAVAFSITLQAEDRTLTDQEMTDIQKKIFSNLEKLGGVIRGK